MAPEPTAEAHASIAPANTGIPPRRFHGDRRLVMLPCSCHGAVRGSARRPTQRSSQSGSGRLGGAQIVVARMGHAVGRKLSGEPVVEEVLGFQNGADSIERFRMPPREPRDARERMERRDRVGGIGGREIAGDFRSVVHGALVAKQEGRRQRTTCAIEHDLRSRDAGKAQAAHAIAFRQLVEGAADRAGKRAPPDFGIDDARTRVGLFCPYRCGGRCDNRTFRRDRADAQCAGAQISAQDNLTDHATLSRGL